MRPAGGGLPPHSSGWHPPTIQATDRISPLNSSSTGRSGWGRFAFDLRGRLDHQGLTTLLLLLRRLLRCRLFLRCHSGPHLLSSSTPLTPLIEASTLFPSSFLPPSAPPSLSSSSLQVSSRPFRFSPPFHVIACRSPSL